MYKFDLKSGYHLIDICQPHHQFLGFQWALGGTRSRYFRFTVLPFGLSSAPYLFTKFFRPLVRYWRGLGIYLVVYLDDGAGCEEIFSRHSTFPTLFGLIWSERVWWLTVINLFGPLFNV